MQLRHQDGEENSVPQRVLKVAKEHGADMARKLVICPRTDVWTGDQAPPGCTIAIISRDHRLGAIEFAESAPAFNAEALDQQVWALLRQLDEAKEMEKKHRKNSRYGVEESRFTQTWSSPWPKEGKGLPAPISWLQMMVSSDCVKVVAVTAVEVEFNQHTVIGAHGFKIGLIKPATTREAVQPRKVIHTLEQALSSTR
jgi:hypothetical protein